MKKLFCLIFVSGCLAVPALAQSARVFDNFDTAAGVQVIKPPEPEPIAAKSKRVFKNGRWVVVVDNKLVRKIVQSSPAKQTQSVSDSLALREPLPNGAASKLAMGSNSYMKGFTTGNPVIDSYIVDSSRRYGIDPLLIYSQMHQESTFKQLATSYKGASGLMQLMPATARRFGVTKIYDPRENIEGGVKYMRWLLDTFNGDVMLALAGYNAGEGAVMKYGWNVPPYRETQEYVRRISARYNAISNGSYIQTARRVSDSKAAELEKKASRPLTIYEPNALAIRLPNGGMMLVNQ